GVWARGAATAGLTCPGVGLGVPAGAASANQPETLYSGRPASALVGVSGRAASRLSPATASGVAPLAPIAPATLGNHWKPSCTVPAIRSGPYCAMLRYGTWVSLVPVTWLKYSPARCCELPMPTEP